MKYCENPANEKKIGKMNKKLKKGVKKEFPKPFSKFFKYKKVVLLGPILNPFLVLLGPKTQAPSILENNPGNKKFKK